MEEEKTIEQTEKTSIKKSIARLNYWFNSLMITQLFIIGISLGISAALLIIHFTK